MDVTSLNEYKEDKRRKQEEYELKCSLYDTHEEMLNKNNIEDFKRIKYMNADGGCSGKERVYNEEQFVKFLNGEPYDAAAIEKYQQFVLGMLDMLKENLAKEEV